VRPNRDLATQPAGPALSSKGHAYQACRSRAFPAFPALFVFFALIALFAPSPARRGGSLRDPHHRRGRLLRQCVKLGFLGGG